MNKINDEICKLQNIIDKNIKSKIFNKVIVLENNFVSKCYIKNFIDKKYFFGIVIEIQNNLEIVKIFLKILDTKINFQNILFCFIDDSSNNIFDIFKLINPSFNYILLETKNKKNISKLKDKEFLYPSTYFIGIEVLKRNSQYFGILNSKSWISNEYFNKAKILINNTKQKSFISLFNTHNYKIIKNDNINNEKLLYINKLNEISLFFNNKVYQKYKNKFLNINQKNFNKINDIFKNINEDIIITKKSYVQNIDIKNKEDLIYLLNPNKYKNLLFDNTFKCSNEKLIKDIVNISNNNEYIIKYKLMLCYDKKCIYQKINGGFGNQLFMLFNLLSLSKEYNLNMIPYFDENYIENYKNENNIIRKPYSDYNILKNIKFYDKINNNFCIFEEKEFIYNKINLKNDNNYELRGFFQSYKYFWKNINNIKNNLNIDYNLIKNIISYYKKFNKDILCIHIRLGDYVNKNDYHPVQSVDYFKKSLSYFNLNNYQIILFSDDFEHAIEILKTLNLSFKKASEYSNNDEVQFYMLMLSQVRICSNSSFSLMSCYLNEMYNFIEDCEYIFPNNWFGPKGPKFNINDLMLNYKFKVIDINNESNIQKKYDVVSTLHSKDLERYKKYIKYNQKYLFESNKYYYISNSNYNLNKSNFIDENKKYPFTKLDVINYIKDYIPNYRWGWYYQQLLKLYIFRIKDIKKDNILVFDTDLLLLKNLKFFENDKFIIYKRNTGDGIIHKPYKISIKYIFPKLDINENDSGICHTMIFNREIINNLLNKIETIHNKDAWKVCLDSIINYIKLNGYTDSIFSEYELYYNFSKFYYEEKFIIEKNLNYLDMSYKKCIENNIFNDFSKNINFIADHHYQSRNENDHKIDNLIEDEKDEINFLESLIKKYNKKKFNINYNNDYLKTFISKLFKFLTFDYVTKKLKEHFTDNNINNIINIECKDKVIKIRKNIDNLIKNFLDNKLEKNYLIKNIDIYNCDLNKDTFYFGIIIPVFNRYYITKIFLESLRTNVNFDSIVFCIVDDGSDSNIINELNDLKYSNIKCAIVKCKRQIYNIFGSDNTKVPGSLYPLTLYIGHELIKNNCKILGVLDSDAIILPNYFKICKSFTKKINMDNKIFSGFNSFSNCHKILGKDKINRTDILYKNMVGGISQFYSVKLYNEFKYKFTGEESDKYWAYDYDFQISNFMMKNNKKYVCLKKSIVQHIGIKSTMIRVGIEHNHNESNIVKIIYNLLINPNTRKDINIEFDFDSNLKFDKKNLNTIFYKSELKNYMNNNIIETNPSREINKLEQLNKLKNSNKNFFFLNKIFYINLDERKDRKKIIEDQFNKFEINNYERFSAIKPEFNKKYNNSFINNQIKKYLNNEKIVNDLFENYDSKYILNFDKNYIKSKNLENQKKYILGALGCKMSYIEIFKICFDKKYDNVLIIEDDALFHNDFINHMKLLSKNVKSINFNYDIIWLCPNWLYKNNNEILNRCYSYTYINDNFALVNSSKSIDNKVGSTLNNGGNIFSKKCIEYILNIFENSEQREIDMWFRHYIQTNNNVYTSVPNLIQQRVEESSIEGFKVNYDKDIHYKTRMKFNIFSIVEEKDKELYLENLKNNLQKMIGYEKIYYISNKKLFNNEILHFIDNKNLENNIDELKNNFKDKVNDNEIKYFYYMDINTKFENNYLPFDENNNLILKDNFYIK